MNSASPHVPFATSAAPPGRGPHLHLLSNGRYHVMLTSAGGGYSRWNDLAVTRWRADPTCDDGGAFCYLRDAVSGEVWSAAYQPTLRRPEAYETSFTTGLAAIRRSDHGIDARTEIAVALEDAVELRRLCIANTSGRPRAIELTTYAEVVLAPAAADAAHPAFSKLFVETEILPERGAILACRRASTGGAPAIWMFHLLGAGVATEEPFSFETDRMRFVGRGRSTVDPQALRGGASLSGSAGPVLDPVAAIRCRIALGSGAATVIDIVSGVGATREACLALIDKYRDSGNADRVLAAASTYSRSILEALHATPADARLFQALAGAVLYPGASLRAPAELLARNRQGQSGLWAYAISGDLPIVLLRIAHVAGIGRARQLVQAHAYWRLHGLAVDLVIVHAASVGEGVPLTEALAKLIADVGQSERIDKPGGLFLREEGRVSVDDLVLLQAVARVVSGESDGPLADRLLSGDAEPNPFLEPMFGRSDGSVESGVSAEPTPPLPQNDLIFANGTGGFSADGREYVITIQPGQMTPVPWVNILANPSFGTLVSESGSAATWSENAQTFRLTPWSNDPVGDANTEAFYIRDEESGRYWSPTKLPCPGTGPYVTRHGFGYSVFEHQDDGVDTELSVFVAIDAPVKFCVLKLKNESGRRRRLSVTGYLQWVLGDEAQKTSMQVNTQLDPDSGALLARNAYNNEFAGRTAFFDADGIAAASVTGDRYEFLGKHGTLRHPAAMSRLQQLSGTLGYALDPCAAICLPCELEHGQTREIVFRLGAGDSLEAAGRLAQRWRGVGAAHKALAAVKAHWQLTLGAVQVETPKRALDLLANGWLLYQVIASRLWARNAFYQSSGAFGFRDQLQDSMALVHAAPELAREQLLRCAGRQFVEGDVQHWWHPPAGRGVRTRCSDDYLWLPLAACRYVSVTGDRAVLDEEVPFLEAPLLEPDQVSQYELPARSAQAASVFEHCVRSIEHGLRFGTHGLPLMGSGDWNDGMNLVGAAGKGESVWLGFFLHFVLTEFAVLAQARGADSVAERYTAQAARLRTAIDANAWDGAWYRRAWFDDGSLLGSSGNAECRIDSIAQSWSVLSGAGTPQRGREAMMAVDQHLVQRDTALIQLLDPPFDHSDPSPGYIQGYVKGIRENGGQYTHAAVWAAMAFAKLGDAERAWELFDMLAPVNHAQSPHAVAVYKTEPYVLASDVYAFAPHAGRGGWTWYTGSAAWMYRFIVESLLGLRVEANKLSFSPCLPADWHSFRLHFRHRKTGYHITVRQTPAEDGAPRLTIDDVEQPGQCIGLIDDRREHTVVLELLAG